MQAAFGGGTGAPRHLCFPRTLEVSLIKADVASSFGAGRSTTIWEIVRADDVQGRSGSSAGFPLRCPSEDFNIISPPSACTNMHKSFE